MLYDEEKNHIRFMREALNEAHQAFSIGEVPVGALIIYKGVVIAKDHNQVEKKKIVPLMQKSFV